MPTKQGFASLPPEKHREYSSKGGKVRVKKGLATLSPERRSEIARKGAETRWAYKKALTRKETDEQEDNTERQG